MTEVANAMEDLEQKRSSRPDNWKELVKEQGERCSKSLNEPRYLLTVYQTGDERLSGGVWDRKEPLFVPDLSKLEKKRIREFVDKGRKLKVQMLVDIEGYINKS